VCGIQRIKMHGETAKFICRVVSKTKSWFKRKKNF